MKDKTPELKEFIIKQPHIEPKPSKYHLSYETRMIDDFIDTFKTFTDYSNPELLEFLQAEKMRLSEISSKSASLSYKADEEREKAKQDAIDAAKLKALNDKLATITDKKDKEKALDLISKLERLNSGTVIYDEYEIELNRLFRFYDAVKN